jgi:hypothetical protein
MYWGAVTSYDIELCQAVTPEFARRCEKAGGRQSDQFREIAADLNDKGTARPGMQKNQRRLDTRFRGYDVRSRADLFREPVIPGY